MKTVGCKAQCEVIPRGQHRLWFHKTAKTIKHLSSNLLLQLYGSISFTESLRVISNTYLQLQNCPWLQPNPLDNNKQYSIICLPMDIPLIALL